MSEKLLFQNTDAQEATYTPQTLASGDAKTRAAADETWGAIPDADDDDTPVAVPVSGSGTTFATPPSQEFDPGMDREERDMARGDTNVLGPDPRDEQETRRD